MMGKEDMLSLLLRKGSEHAFSFYILFVVFILVFFLMLFFLIRRIIISKKWKKDQKKDDDSSSVSSPVASKDSPLSNELPHDVHRWENEGGPIHKDEDS